MKFSWKIFIYTYMIIVISFSIGGFLIIENAFENNLNSRRDGLIDSNRYLAESYMAMRNLDERLNTQMGAEYRSSVNREDEHSIVYIGMAAKIKNYERELFDENITEGKRLVRVTYLDGVPYLQVVSRPVTETQEIYSYVESMENVTQIFKDRDENYRMFQIILVSVSAVSGLILFLLSKHLTAPLKYLSQTAREIGSGKFDKRVDRRRRGIKGSEEILSLTEDFNRMAGYVESYIEELKEENRRREEFVGNFTHELKTPLTSVIGYADLLRSYELDSEKRRQFADFIYKEGMRMEALALHLLDLIVLKRQDFDIKETRTEYFFHEMGETLRFLLEKYHAVLHIDCEKAEICIEADLMKTLIYNLVDNGCKAMADNKKIGKPADIFITGKCGGERYLISVRDSGIGIPKDEIYKITEAFYMVDKSRARTMGGAGLGLALCKEIAEIHGSRLEIESGLGMGTAVFFDVPIYKGEEKGEE